MDNEKSSPHQPAEEIELATPFLDIGFDLRSLAKSLAVNVVVRT